MIPATFRSIVHDSCSLKAGASIGSQSVANPGLPDVVEDDGAAMLINCERPEIPHAIWTRRLFSQSWYKVPMRPWTVLKSRYLLKRWWMNVREDHVRLPGGAELEEFHVIEYPDWACVICLDEADRLVMVRQYRHAVGRVSLEFPAGSLDKDETPLEGAKRELLEETGYSAERWISMGKCAPDPSKHDHYAHLFVAYGAHPVQAQQLDESEDVGIEIIGLEQIGARVNSGELFHGIHLAAFYMAREKGFLDREIRKP